MEGENVAKSKTSKLGTALLPTDGEIHPHVAYSLDRAAKGAAEN
jgi:hypothetical protein